jgi:hypothetical protein
MKRHIKQTTDITEFTKSKQLVDPIISDISVDSLISDCLLALHREIKNILILGVGGKLEANDARDLRDHLKLLFEIKDRETSFLKTLSDEELKGLMDRLNEVNK